MTKLGMLLMLVNKVPPKTYARSILVVPNPVTTPNALTIVLRIVIMIPPLLMFVPLLGPYMPFSEQWLPLNYD